MKADHRLAFDLAIILLATALLASTAATAQTCQTLPVDEKSPSHYRLRPNMPRCEGMYRSPVSGPPSPPSMTLVSLTFGRVSYDPSRDTHLELRLAAAAAEKTSLRGVGVPERFPYRFDAELAPGESVFRFSLADVIARERISSENLGFYGLRSGPRGQNGFVPVHARARTAASDGRVVAIVRPNADVTDVQWRHSAPGAPLGQWSPVHAGVAELVPAGTRLEIVLNEAMPARSFLEFSFLWNGNDGAAQFLLFAR